MSIILNNAVAKELYLGSDKISKVYLGSNLIYQLASNTVLYENTNTYTGTGLKFSTGALTTDRNFIAITFKLSTSTANADSYVYLRTTTDTSKNIWIGNARRYGGYAYASYFRSSSNGWNALMNPSTGSDGSNTGNVFYAASLNAADTHDYKIVFDISSGKAYCYINKLNILNADYITFNPLNFEAGTDGSDVTFGNIKVIACETLADALTI